VDEEKSTSNKKQITTAVIVWLGYVMVWLEYVLLSGTYLKKRNNFRNNRWLVRTSCKEFLTVKVETAKSC